MAQWQTLSDRINTVAPSATLAVDSKAKAMKAAGLDVVGFGAGEPNFPTPANVVKAAADACLDPKELQVHDLRRACPSCAKRLRLRCCAIPAMRSMPISRGDQRRQAGRV